MIRITKYDTVKPPEAEKKKLRVAGYCRVSTGSDDQLESMDAQKAHYESVIRANPAWEYAGLFYDEGISGTKMVNREGLQALLQACRNGEVDHIITKSISRFARNTIDCISTVRNLLERGITIYFEKENINTGAMEGELMLSIMSSLAADESASLSGNVKWGIKKRFRDGTYIISTPPYGYKNINKKVVVDEAEAAIVREIFSSYLSGKGSCAIAKELNQRGVPSRKTNHWTGTTIKSILTNESYTGDVIFQKTYKDDSYNRHVNRGNIQRYSAKDHHEAIISHEDFEMVNELLAQRAAERNSKPENSRNRYPFSSKIICGECGSTFKRRIHYSKSGSYIAWTCKNHLDDKDICSMQFITEEAIKSAFVTMMRKLHFTRKQLLLPLVNDLKSFNADENRFLDLEKYADDLEKNTEQKEIIIRLAGNGLLNNDVYEKQLLELNTAADHIQQKKTTLSRRISTCKDAAEDAGRLLKHITGAAPMELYDEQAFTDHVEKIIVISRSEIEFHLKCGLKLREKLKEED